MIKIIISTDAVEDLEGGFEFYESQNPGLGDYFISCLQGDIEGLRITAGIHRVALRKHRLLSRVFPYAIYYTIDGKEVVVWAVIDCRRNPHWIRARLRGD